MKVVLPTALFFLSVFLEGTVTTIPLCLITILLLSLLIRKRSIFALAFFSGLLLDVFLLRNLGTTSFFYLLYLGIIELYEKKFEIRSYQFVTFAAFLGGISYAFIFVGSYILFHALITILMSTILFWFFKRIYKEEFATKHLDLREK